MRIRMQVFLRVLAFLDQWEYRLILEVTREGGHIPCQSGVDLSSFHSIRW